MGLSQAAFAARVGAARKAVMYQWESRQRCPSPLFWQRIRELKPDELECRRRTIHAARVENAQDAQTDRRWIRDFDVPQEKRLVLAIEQAAVDILHACGRNARCTTCRVEFIAREPTR